MEELKNVKLYPSLHKMNNNREWYTGVDFSTITFSIQEKIDGSNISIFKLDNKIHIFSRTMNITSSLTTLKGLSVFIETNLHHLDRFLNEGEVLNGEWLATGLIKYVSTLSELEFSSRFVIFNLGKLSELAIKALRGSLTSEESLAIKEAGTRAERKIDFYPNDIAKERISKDEFLSTLKSTIGSLSDEVFIFERFETEFKIYDATTKEYLGNTKDDSFEKYLTTHPIYSKSILYPTSEAIEGVIFKSNDNSIILKYVLGGFVKKVPKPQKKSKGDKEVESLVELTNDQLEWLDFKVKEDGRFNKFIQYISLKSIIFKGLNSEEIAHKIHENNSLLANIFSYVMWLYDDIAKEEDGEDSQWFKEKTNKRAIKKALIVIIRKLTIWLS